MLSIPHLYSKTVAVPEISALSGIVPDTPALLAWLHGDDGMVAAGTAARLDIAAPRTGGNSARTNSSAQSNSSARSAASSRFHDSRFHEARCWWEALLDQATIIDDVQLPGTGLVAFGSFSFSPDSPAGSALIVPQVIVGKRGTSTWLTFIGTDASHPYTSLCTEAQQLLDAVTSTSGMSDATSADDEGSIMARISREIPSEDQWMDHVAQVRKSILHGEAEKVVLAREVEFSAEQDLNVRSLIRTLNHDYRNTWVFAVDGMVGATPEMLASTLAPDDRAAEHQATDTVMTRVLAGTLPQDSSSVFLNSPRAPYEDSDAAFTSSHKDREEHRLAAESAIRALEPLATLTMDGPFILRLPNVLHFATDIYAALHDGVSMFDVIAALHPTAALGGTPRTAALELISRIESHDRDRYGAPVGWICSGGASQWGVALRCARITAARTARAWVGAGIMADSLPESELLETKAKLQPIMAALHAEPAEPAESADPTF